MTWPGEKDFDKKLFALRSKSGAKINALAKTALKHVKYYKFVVHSVEKFIRKGRESTRIPGLFVVDAICRHSKAKFKDKDVFTPRFGKNIDKTFAQVVKCSVDDLPSVQKVLTVWQQRCWFNEDTMELLRSLLNQRAGKELMPASEPKPTPVQDKEEKDAAAIQSIATATVARLGEPPAAEEKAPVEWDFAEDDPFNSFDYGDEEDDEARRRRLREAVEREKQQRKEEEARARDLPQSPPKRSRWGADTRSALDVLMAQGKAAAASHSLSALPPPRKRTRFD